MLRMREREGASIMSGSWSVWRRWKSAQSHPFITSWKSLFSILSKVARSNAIPVLITACTRHTCSSVFGIGYMVEGVQGYLAHKKQPEMARRGGDLGEVVHGL